MRFCPNCGAPLKTTAVPTQVITFSDQPSQPYRPLSGSRQVPMLAGLAIAWGFLAFFMCWSNDVINHLAIFPIIALVALGSLGGFFLTRFFTLRQLRVLEEKGEIKTPLRTTIFYILLVIGALIIVIALLIYYMPLIPTSSLYLSYNFLYPTTVAIFATRATFYSNWERKNKKQIFAENRRLLALPKIEQSRTSFAWYLLPLFLSIFGGIIGYKSVKDRNPGRADNILVIGIFLFVIEVVVGLAFVHRVLLSKVSRGMLNPACNRIDQSFFSNHPVRRQRLVGENF